MAEHVIEVVAFALKPGTDEAAFLATAAAPVSEFLKGRDGFIRRRLAKGTEGKWIEHVEWASMADALAAAEAFRGDPRAQPLLAAIDPASVAMGHYIVVDEAG
jgi:hypothetical protein